MKALEIARLNVFHKFDMAPGGGLIILCSSCYLYSERPISSYNTDSRDLDLFMQILVLVTCFYVGMIIDAKLLVKYLVQSLYADFSQGLDTWRGLPRYGRLLKTQIATIQVLKIERTLCIYVILFGLQLGKTQTMCLLSWGRTQCVFLLYYIAGVVVCLGSSRFQLFYTVACLVALSP